MELLHTGFARQFRFLDVLGKNLFISKCHRTGMEEYYECFIDHQAAEKTRLLLPFAAQLRTYSVIWLT